MVTYSKGLDGDPLASWDPVPGDAAELATLATAWERTALAIQAASDALKRMAASPDGSSDAVVEFKKLSGSTGDDLGKAQARYESAASAMKDYASQLARIQDRAATALSLAKQADADRKTAQNQQACLVPSDDGDDSTARRIQANLTQYTCDLADQQTALREAVRDFDELAEKTATLIEGGFDDGLQDNLWEKFSAVLAEIAKFTDQIAGWVGLAALVLSWVPVLGQVLAIVALVAGAVSLIAKIVNFTTGTADLVDVIGAAVGVFGGAIGRGLSTVLKGGVAAIKGFSAASGVASKSGAAARSLFTAGAKDVSKAAETTVSQLDRFHALAGNPFKTMGAGFAKPFKKLAEEVQDLGLGTKITRDTEDWFALASVKNAKWGEAWDGGKGLIPSEIKNLLSVRDIGRDAELLESLSAWQRFNLGAMTKAQDMALLLGLAGKVKFVQSEVQGSHAH